MPLNPPSVARQTFFAFIPYIFCFSVKNFRNISKYRQLKLIKNYKKIPGRIDQGSGLHFYYLLFANSENGNQK